MSELVCKQFNEIVVSLKNNDVNNARLLLAELDQQDLSLAARSLSENAFFPNSSLFEKFYPRNINYMPVVKFYKRLDLRKNAYSRTAS